MRRTFGTMVFDGLVKGCVFRRVLTGKSRFRNVSKLLTHSATTQDTQLRG
ncbi:hypothetical protein CCP2SC5_440027 [Azospirillaceae bacterium]